MPDGALLCMVIKHLKLKTLSHEDGAVFIVLPRDSRCSAPPLPPPPSRGF